MGTAKQLLTKHVEEAFRGRPDMPLAASLAGVTQEEAAWQPDPSLPSIEQLVRHVAWAKSFYCREGFGRPMVIHDPSVNDDGDVADLPLEFPCGAGWGRATHPGIDGAIRLLEETQQVLVECLTGCTDEQLDQPIPTRHGRTAAHFFWVMAMHDLYHAGQIRTRRSLYRLRTG